MNKIRFNFVKNPVDISILRDIKSSWLKIDKGKIISVNFPYVEIMGTVGETYEIEVVPDPINIETKQDAFLVERYLNYVLNQPTPALWPETSYEKFSPQKAIISYNGHSGILHQPNEPVHPKTGGSLFTFTKNPAEIFRGQNFFRPLREEKVGEDIYRSSFENNQAIPLLVANKEPV